MTPRHAAALALVGWWLMVPPINKGAADFKAPMRGWTKVEGDFDSALACGKALSNQKYMASELGDSGYAPSTKLQNEVIGHGQCVDQNDPRLKAWKGGFIGTIS